MATDNKDPIDPGNGMNRLKYPPQDPSIRARLPKSVSNGNTVNGDYPPLQPPPPINPPIEVASAPQPAGNKKRWWENGFFPSFWTIASIFSVIMNCLIVGVLLALIPLARMKPNDPVAKLLGGLYGNFRDMEDAEILASVPIRTTIPLDNIIVPVNTATTIYVQPGQSAQLSSVNVQTGGLTIRNATGSIIFGQTTPLNVQLNLNIPLQHIDVPVNMDVPVTIRMKDTQLSGPFVGLQNVITPLYCLVEPQAELTKSQTCPSFNDTVQQVIGSSAP